MMMPLLLVLLGGLTLVTLVGFGFIILKIVTTIQSDSRILHHICEGFSSQLEQNRTDAAMQAQMIRTELGSLLDRNHRTTSTQLDRISTILDQKLEVIRLTVDEKLHATLEKRLGESFKLVSERLEQVHKGLGDMQQLAVGVGDLKKVLSNVKTAGTWGEVQLYNLLDQLLIPEQYAKNIATKHGSQDRVEYAIRLPGRDSDVVWIPIDSKFPQAAYQRLVDALDSGDPIQVQTADSALATQMKLEAKSIKDKYIDPPFTTDFAILFLPIEGLYGEVLRHPGLYDQLLREYRVIVAGPTTLAAILSSLQMGFRTLAIEKRSSEVWALLAAVKTEFEKFGGILDKTQKKLQEAANTIELAGQKSRTIQRRLRDVQHNAIDLPDTGLPAFDSTHPELPA